MRVVDSEVLFGLALDILNADDDPVKFGCSLFVGACAHSGLTVEQAIARVKCQFPVAVRSVRAQRGRKDKGRR